MRRKSIVTPAAMIYGTPEFEAVAHVFRVKAEVKEPSKEEIAEKANKLVTPEVMGKIENELKIVAEKIMNERGKTHGENIHEKRNLYNY